jgi:hypothetical protein
MPKQKKSRILTEVGDSMKDLCEAGVIDIATIEFEQLLKRAVPIPSELLERCIELTKDVEVSHDEEIPDESSI